ncbi:MULTISPECIES: TetR/AcrR family transcriptional regulator [Sphingomonadales]|uniref:Transcriptional regulator, TetR family n=1 Tax=Rhizorhabdus wittichii (strain DSM 6014 / CCUG 31198 / JCM 15750 / NBRC 105917 / EY 4224 / RW1) TaxID=392499 RepID=A0A9J9HG23_RHIWR|nr:transcriptional regulator, TetR family [Rhizorhabdus wittichii RW1]
MPNDLTDSVNARRYMQARGRARREALLDAARLLLQQRDADEISFSMVSEVAGIPSSSAYHFFPDMRELYKALARAIADEMIELEPAIDAESSWDAILADFLKSSADFFNANAAARQLMLGPRVSPEIRQAACHDDHRFGVLLHRLFDERFLLPEMSEPVSVFFRVVHIADAFFALSVLEDGCVSPHMVVEATRAATGYLANYLPPILQARASLPDHLPG